MSKADKERKQRESQTPPDTETEADKQIGVICCR